MLDARYWILDPPTRPNLPADDADNPDPQKGKSASICVICGKTNPKRQELREQVRGDEASMISGF
jgi:hypothetical protein